MNMLERGRLESKKISETAAVTSTIPYDLDPEKVHVGPSDYVPGLEDRKWCHIRMEGATFGNVPPNLEMKLEERKRLPSGTSSRCSRRATRAGQSQLRMPGAVHV